MAQTLANHQRGSSLLRVWCFARRQSVKVAAPAPTRRGGTAGSGGMVRRARCVFFRFSTQQVDPRSKQATRKCRKPWCQKLPTIFFFFLKKKIRKKSRSVTAIIAVSSTDRSVDTHFYKSRDNVPGRSMSGFHPPGIHYYSNQARSTARCPASRT